MLPRRGCLAASKMGPRGRGRSNFGYFGGIPSPPLWRPQTHQKPPFRHLRPGSTMYTQELSANVSGCPDSPRVGWTCEVLESPMARGKTEGRGTRVFPCEVSFVRTAPYLHNFRLKGCAVYNRTSERNMVKQVPERPPRSCKNYPLCKGLCSRPRVFGRRDSPSVRLLLEYCTNCNAEPACKHEGCSNNSCAQQDKISARGFCANHYNDAAYARWR